MASIYMMGDGSKLCAKHLAEQYPDKMEPENGWTVGSCDICSRSKAASAMGRAKSPRKAAASRANGAKGGRPRKAI